MTPEPTPRCVRMAHLAFVLILGTALQMPAAANAAADPEPDQEGQEGQEAAEIKLPIKKLLPDRSRFFRGFKLTTSYLDQEDFSIDTTTGAPEANPDDHLWKFELSLDLSKVMWSTDELVAVYALAAGTDTGGLVEATGFDTTYVGSEPLEFFARARKRDGFRRFASAFTLSTGQSERPTPEPLDPSEPPRKVEEFEETYSVTFDPKKIFLTADRVLSAYKGVESFVKVHRVPSGLGAGGKTLASASADQLGMSTAEALEAGSAIEVLRALSGLKVASQSLVAAIPAIEVKTVDQFDFASIGGMSRSSPFVEGSIETITATWDLASALNTAERRRSALQAIALHEKLVKQDAKLEKGLEIVPNRDVVLCTGQYGYVPFGTKNALGTVSWSARGLPEGLELDAKTGVLQGTPLAPRTFRVIAADGFKAGREAQTHDLLAVPCP